MPKGTGLTILQGRTLGKEKLTLIQVYKGLALAQCTVCACCTIFEVNKNEGHAWACDPCDRKRVTETQLAA